MFRGFRRLGDPWWNRFSHLGGPGLPNPCQTWIQRANFEGGTTTPNPTGFDAVVGAGLVINAAARALGDLGLQVTIAGGVSTYGRLTGPNNETQATIDFWFDPNSIAIPAGNSRVFQLVGGAAVVAEIFYIPGGQFQMRALEDGGGFATSGGGAIADAYGLFRVEMFMSSAVGADDGFMRLYRNNVLVLELTGIDNDTRDIDEIRIGTVAPNAAINGTVYFDDIKWSRNIC